MISGPGLRTPEVLWEDPGAESPELLLKNKSNGRANQLDILRNIVGTLQ
jgi:hypothetical protein